MRLLYIDDCLWKEFKLLVPRGAKLNDDAVVDLIRERVKGKP